EGRHRPDRRLRGLTPQAGIERSPPLPSGSRAACSPEKEPSDVRQLHPLEGQRPTLRPLARSRRPGVLPLERQRRRRPRRSRHRRLLLRTPLADPLLPGAPHRRPAQTPRPRLPTHPRHRNEEARDDARDRLWPGRRLHRAKARKALRSRERGRRDRRNSCGMGLTPNRPPDDRDASDVGRPPFGAALYSRLSAAREARDRSSPSRDTIADAFLPPQLAAWQAVWRGHRPSRLQGALPMKAPGSIRLGNKRAGAPGKPGPGEIAVDIDRKNRVLGNPFVLQDPTDAAARNDVVERFRAKYVADLKCDGPMSAATEALAERVRKGERLICMCWCW